MQSGSTVNLDETANRGDAFLALLGSNQRAKIINIANAVTDKPNGTLWQMTDVRTAINEELRKLMVTNTVDEAKLSNLQYRLGYLDGSIVASLVAAYTEIYWSMNSTQLVEMRTLRNPQVPRQNCPSPDMSQSGGTWVLASPVPASVVREDQPQQIWSSTPYKTNNTQSTSQNDISSTSTPQNVTSTVPWERFSPLPFPVVPGNGPCERLDLNWQQVCVCALTSLSVYWHLLTPFMVFKGRL